MAYALCPCSGLEQSRGWRSVKWADLSGFNDMLRHLKALLMKSDQAKGSQEPLGNMCPWEESCLLAPGEKGPGCLQIPQGQPET